LLFKRGKTASQGAEYAKARPLLTSGLLRISLDFYRQQEPPSQHAPEGQQFALGAEAAVGFAAEYPATANAARVRPLTRRR